MNAVYGGSNWIDCVFENCWFGNVSRMGCEFTKTGPYTLANRRTRFIRCTAENCGSYGFSSGFGEDNHFVECLAKNVGEIGFEFAGSGPLAPVGAPADGSGMAWGMLDSCVVDGLVGLSEGTKGFSIEGARDVQVRGATRISNLSSPAPLKDYAICVHACERCSIRGVTARNYGTRGLVFRRGYSLNTGGFHVADDNEFYNMPGDSERIGIYVEDTTVSLRNNINWAAGGTNMNNQTHCVAPARAIVDGVDVPGDAYIRGSNITVEAAGTIQD
jgi:hypothetical protein